MFVYVHYVDCTVLYLRVCIPDISKYGVCITDEYLNTKPVASDLDWLGEDACFNRGRPRPACTVLPPHSYLSYHVWLSLILLLVTYTSFLVSATRGCNVQCQSVRMNCSHISFSGREVESR